MVPEEADRCWETTTALLARQKLGLGVIRMDEFFLNYFGGKFSRQRKCPFGLVWMFRRKTWTVWLTDISPPFKCPSSASLVAQTVKDMPTMREIQV